MNYSYQSREVLNDMPEKKKPGRPLQQKEISFLRNYSGTLQDG